MNSSSKSPLFFFSLTLLSSRLHKRQRSLLNLRRRLPRVFKAHALALTLYFESQCPIISCTAPVIGADAKGADSRNYFYFVQLIIYACGKPFWSQCLCQDAPAWRAHAVGLYGAIRSRPEINWTEGRVIPTRGWHMGRWQALRGDAGSSGLWCNPATHHKRKRTTDTTTHG